MVASPPTWRMFSMLPVTHLLRVLQSPITHLPIAHATCFTYFSPTVHRPPSTATISGTRRGLPQPKTTSPVQVSKNSLKKREAVWLGPLGPCSPLPFLRTWTIMFTKATDMHECRLKWKEDWLNHSLKEKEARFIHPVRLSAKTRRTWRSNPQKHPQ